MAAPADESALAAAALPGASSGATGPDAPPRSANPLGPVLFRWIRAIGLLLMAIDVAALTLLLYRLGLPAAWALGLALVSGGFGTYQAQFAHLLSRDAFLVHGSPGRHLAMALVVLASNLFSLQLVADSRYGAYALARVVLALAVVWAWGRRVGPKLLGDGLARLDRKVFEDRLIG